MNNDILIHANMQTQTQKFDNTFNHFLLYVYTMYLTFISQNSVDIP